jgi:hypothetical protein
MTMNYTPKQENKYVTPIAVTLIAVGIVVYLLPNFAPIRAVVCQMIAMLCMVAAVFVLVRYNSTAFIYTIRPRSRTRDEAVERMEPKELDFVVSKQQGSRSPNMECVLSLSDLEAVWEISPEVPYKKVGEAMEKARVKYGTVNLYDYTVTLGLKTSLLLLFRDGEKHAAIRIEPNEEFQRFLRDAAVKNGKKE